jgi:chromosomal replication initiation ATPase DnaA
MNPTQSDFAIADLASRFRAAPVATIKAPDDTLLASVLIKLFADRQLSVGNEIISYILPRMERSFVAAKDIVENIDTLAYSKKKGVSIPLIRQVLTAMQSEEY